MEPQIQYCTTTDGVSIAYSVVGSGPPLVRVTPVLWNHVEAWWRIAQYREMAERLAESYTFINYDARGTGLSQRGAEDFRMEARLLDLEAVLAALDIGRSAMLSSGPGCPMAVAYAVRNPERVSKLALVNPFARGVDWRQLPQMRARDSARAMAEEVWGQYRMDVAMSLVDNSDAELARQVGDVMAEAMTPATLRLFFQQGKEVDVSGLLPRVNVPTLILVGRNRPWAELSREVAARIPGARVTSVDTAHFGWLSGGAVAALETFLAKDREGKPAPEQSSGGLVTILFTDIVGHTEMMQRLGDDAGRTVLREHERITRETLSAYGGAEVKTDGDSFMASFTSVSSAVECAVALQRAFAHHSETTGEPIVVRMGLNVGEPIEEDGDFFGSAVILGARIKDQAGGGEILVPEAVRHLLSGKPFPFAERGVVDLKGFEDPVRLYEVRWRK
jgi:class 3 adenylate cyclase/alpha-beta hydrolase superfamily lysophospholipase